LTLREDHHEQPLQILHHFPAAAGHGKVRDNYAVGDDKLLIVTTDRLSAFDVIMNEPIPGKGKVLNQMAISGSRSWATSCPTT
jgi:phosphoribosylaminoimidazole-succinocarboxamide synthase